MRRSVVALILSMGVASGSAIRLVAQTADQENIILGRPTDSSIVVHALADEGMEVFAEYGQSAGRHR